MQRKTSPLMSMSSEIGKETPWVLCNRTKLNQTYCCANQLAGNDRDRRTEDRPCWAELVRSEQYRFHHPRRSCSRPAGGESCLFVWWSIIFPTPVHWESEINGCEFKTLNSISLVDRETAYQMPDTNDDRCCPDVQSEAACPLFASHRRTQFRSDSEHVFLSITDFL